MSIPPIKVQYGRAMASAPLLHGLAGCALSVPAMAAVLQALAELRYRAAPFDELRTKIIQANQQRHADGTLEFENGDKNRPMVTAKGLTKLAELERQDLDMYCRTVEPEAFVSGMTANGAKLTLTGYEMATLGWFIVGADLPAGAEIPPPAAPAMPEDAPAEALPAEAMPTQA